MPTSPQALPDVDIEWWTLMTRHDDGLAVTVLQALADLGGAGTSWEVTAQVNRAGDGTGPPQPAQVQDALRQMELTSPPLTAVDRGFQPPLWSITAAGTAALARAAR